MKKLKLELKKMLLFVVLCGWLEIWKNFYWCIKILPVISNNRNCNYFEIIFILKIVFQIFVISDFISQVCNHMEEGLPGV